MRKTISWLAGLSATALIGAGAVILALPSRTPAGAVSPAELTNIVNEVMSVGELYRSPEPNHSQSEMAYMRAMEGWRGLARTDLRNGSTEVMHLDAEARRLFSWSPDDRFLLLKDAPNYNERLRLYDAAPRSFRPATQERNFGVEQAVWLGTNRFAYISKHGQTAELRLVTLGQPCKVVHTFPNPGTMDWMTAMSENRVAFLENREICSLDLQTSIVTQLTTNLCRQYLWLNYAPETGEFLFCSSDGSEWRHLFKLSAPPGQQPRLTQLTFGPDHTYNGQWIQGGTGYACVCNNSNQFFLAIRPANKELSTNLFVGGHVLAYRVAADGHTLYAAAALGMEPSGVWRYDISARMLSCLVPGTNRPFATARVLPAEAYWAESYDGLLVPYYLLKPRVLQPHSTHPVVLGIPPESGQFTQSWEKYGQFLANIGAFYAAVNPRGSDGYGSSFRKNHPEEAWRDVLAVRAQLLRDPGVDPKRVYLLTWSAGSGPANRLALEHSELWNGVAVISGAAPHTNSLPPSLPRYLVFIGEMDRRGFRPGVKAFKEWADSSGAEVTLLTDPKTTHIITDINVDRRLGFALAHFIFPDSEPSAASFAGPAK